MKCPKCSASIKAKPDEAGFLKCPSCGVRLRTKTQPVFKAKVAPYTPPRPLPVAGAGSSPADRDKVLAQEAARQMSADATIPRGVDLPRIPRPGEVAPPPPAPAARAPQAPATLEGVLAEIRALRQTQGEILALLKQERPPRQAPAPRPATVLVIDDDAATRSAVADALERAGIQSGTVAEGREALAAIAAEKPGAIALELDLGGSMTGKDLVNTIRATMEWVDIPLVLYTRVSLASEDEARAVHGADHYIKKGPQSAEALVARMSRILGKG